MKLHEAIEQARAHVAAHPRTVAILGRTGDPAKPPVQSYDGDGAVGETMIFNGYVRAFTVSPTSRRWSALLGWTDDQVLADDWNVRAVPLAKMGRQVRYLVPEIRRNRGLRKVA